MHLSFVFPERPRRVYWEVTRSCDLACRHCRAEAVPNADPDQLTPAEGLRLLDDLARFAAPRPHLVLTGGDPLKRVDLFELIAAARERGFQVSVAPSATPLLTGDTLRRIRDSGVDAISLSLDGSDAERHDAIRGIAGTYERTRDAARVAREVGLPFQVNTLVCQETADDLPAIHEQLVALGAARWSLFFLVTVGRGQVLRPVTPACAEALLGWLASLSGPPAPGRLIVSTTEAPHFRRVVSERRREAQAQRPPNTSAGQGAPGGPEGHGAGIRDGNGILFISHTGEICPSGFLEIPTGNVRRDDVVQVYRAHPLFAALRNPDAFHGRCGPCEFRWLCGGSRARAYSASHDPLGEDPLCEHDASRVPLGPGYGVDAAARAGRKYQFTAS
jgi:radical SAM protein